MALMSPLRSMVWAVSKSGTSLRRKAVPQFTPPYVQFCSDIVDELRRGRADAVPDDADRNMCDCTPESITEQYEAQERHYYRCKHNGGLSQEFPDVALANP